MLMLTECNVRDCCRLAESMEARHIYSASAGFSQSCRRNIQENVLPNPRASSCSREASVAICGSCCYS